MIIKKVYCFIASWVLVPLAVVVLLIVWSDGGSAQFDQLIKDNTNLLTSVGVLILVSLIGLLTTTIASRSLEMVEKDNRKSRTEMASLQLQNNAEMARVGLTSAKEIKIAEFRQTWINDMRSDVAEYVSLTMAEMISEDFKDEPRRQRMTELSSQIFLRLNPTEDLSEELAQTIRAIAEARRGRDVEALNQLLRDFASTSREILKGEWKRLKDDLDKAIASTVTKDEM